MAGGEVQSGNPEQEQKQKVIHDVHDELENSSTDKAYQECIKDLRKYSTKAPEVTSSEEETKEDQPNPEYKPEALATAITEVLQSPEYKDIAPAMVYAWINEGNINASVDTGLGGDKFRFDQLNIEGGTEKVKEVQKILQNLGYDVGEESVNGVYGPKTKEAVIKLQTLLCDKGLYEEPINREKEIDGLFGDKTLKALNEMRKIGKKEEKKADDKTPKTPVAMSENKPTGPKEVPTGDKTNAPTAKPSEPVPDKLGPRVEAKNESVETVDSLVGNIQGFAAELGYSFSDKPDTENGRIIMVSEAKMVDGKTEPVDAKKGSYSAMISNPESADGMKALAGVRDDLMLKCFVARGASPEEAAQQMMLRKEYKINTTVEAGDKLGMLEASTNVETVREILKADAKKGDGDKGKLKPKVAAYLQQYLNGNTEKVNFLVANAKTLSAELGYKFKDETRKFDEEDRRVVEVDVPTGQVLKNYKGNDVKIDSIYAIIPDVNSTEGVQRLQVLSVYLDQKSAEKKEADKKAVMADTPVVKRGGLGEGLIAASV